MSNPLKIGKLKKSEQTKNLRNFIKKLTCLRLFIKNDLRLLRFSNPPSTISSWLPFLPLKFQCLNILITSSLTNCCFVLSSDPFFKHKIFDHEQLWVLQENSKKPKTTQISVKLPTNYRKPHHNRVGSCKMVAVSFGIDYKWYTLYHSVKAFSS